MAHVDNLRRYFTATRHVTYLDTGTRGIMPTTALESMRTVLSGYAEAGRSYVDESKRLADVKDKVREHFAKLLLCHPDNVSLFQSVGQAFHSALAGFPFAPGDEVLCISGLSDEFALPLLSVTQRNHVIVQWVEGSSSGDALVQRLRECVCSRTRFIICPHVSADTGFRMPLAEISDVARQAGAYFVIDGSLGIGADGVTVNARNTDMYCMPGNKWLCGPDDTAAAYISHRLLSAVHTSLVGTHNLVQPDAIDLLGSFQLHSTAKRLDANTTNFVNWTGLLESLHFLRVSVGWDYAFARTEGLTGQCIDGLLDIPGVKLLTPRDARAGTVVLTSEHGLDCDEVMHAANARDIIVRPLRRNRAIQVSLGFYNSEDDVSRFTQFVRSHFK